MAKSLEKPRKRTRLSPDDRRDQLVEIGTRLFADRAMGEVWVDDVAAAAGVSRGLIYHYFPTKSDFYKAVLQRSFDLFHEQTAPDPELGGLERVRKGVAALIDYVDSHRHGYMAINNAANGGDPEIRELILEARERSVDQICRSIVGEDQEVPELVRLAVKGYQASAIALCVDWLERETLNRDEMVELGYAMFIGALGAVAFARPELRPMLFGAAEIEM